MPQLRSTPAPPRNQFRPIIPSTPPSRSASAHPRKDQLETFFQLNKCDQIDISCDCRRCSRLSKRDNHFENYPSGLLSIEVGWYLRVPVPSLSFKGSDGLGQSERKLETPAHLKQKAERSRQGFVESLKSKPSLIFPCPDFMSIFAYSRAPVSAASLVFFLRAAICSGVALG